MTYTTIASEIRSILAERLWSPEHATALTDDEPLAEGSLNITSLAALEILAAVEARFGVTFPDDALDPAMFETVRRLATTVGTLLADRSGT